MSARKRKEARLVPTPPGPEHPEDKVWREAAETSATRMIDAWLREHPNALRDLIATYVDGDAEELLACLREDFWGETVDAEPGGAS